MEYDLPALVDDSYDLINDEVQKDDSVNADPSGNQHREVDHSESSDEILGAHSGTGFQPCKNSAFWPSF